MLPPRTIIFNITSLSFIVFYSNPKRMEEIWRDSLPNNWLVETPQPFTGEEAWQTVGGKGADFWNQLERNFKNLPTLRLGYSFSLSPFSPPLPPPLPLPPGYPHSSQLDSPCSFTVILKMEEICETLPVTGIQFPCYRRGGFTDRRGENLNQLERFSKEKTADIAVIELITFNLYKNKKNNDK